MIAKPTMPLVFLALFGCAHTGRGALPPGPLVSAPAEAPAAQAAKPDGKPAAQSGRLDAGALDIERSGQLEVERQVAELRQAVELYRQFIERADGQAELAAAVEQSRQRIDDACGTIVFLLQDAAKVAPGGC